jgi:hypothetical protein
MKDVRTRIVVALASSTVLASGLSVAAVAVTSGTSTAVTVAGGAPTGTAATPNITVVDP